MLVSNAGIGVPGLLHEVPVADLERELRTNLLGPMLLARRALPAMLARKRGDLVFISSMNVVEPRPFQAGYTAAKAGRRRAGADAAEGSRGHRRALDHRPARAPPAASSASAGSPTSWCASSTRGRQWGYLRHLDMMDGEQVARAVVAAVTAPPGAPHGRHPSEPRARGRATERQEARMRFRGEGRDRDRRGAGHRRGLRQGARGRRRERRRRRRQRGAGRSASPRRSPRPAARRASCASTSPRPNRPRRWPTPPSRPTARSTTW